MLSVCCNARPKEVTGDLEGICGKCEKPTVFYIDDKELEKIKEVTEKSNNLMKDIFKALEIQDINFSGGVE